VFVPGKSPVKVQPEILDMFLSARVAHCLYGPGEHISLRVVNVIHKMKMKTVTGHFVCGVDNPLNVLGLNQLLTAK
jgi:hypothetical protein